MAALYPAWLRCELDRDKVNLVDGLEDELIEPVDCSRDETFQAITPSCNPIQPIARLHLPLGRQGQQAVAGYVTCCNVRPEIGP